MGLLNDMISGPVAVIGDIHGHLDRLQSIESQLMALPDSENRWIVFIGDFLDRGPDPRGVLNAVIDLHRRHRRVTACAGNHELAAAASLHLVQTPSHSNWHERWVRHYDSQSTFDSYGTIPGDLPSLREAMPKSHQMFLKLLPWCVEHPDFLFVHAGLDLSQPYRIQRRILAQRDFTLNRPTWLCDRNLGNHDVPSDCRLSVVSGHVQVPQVQVSKRRILLDTSGGGDGELSCLLLPEMQVLTSSGEAGEIDHRSRRRSKHREKRWV